MTIQFNSPKNALDILKKMGKVVGKNPVLPILENFLIQVKKDIVTVTVTDLETSVKTILPNVVAKVDFDAAVPAKFFTDALSKFDDTKPVACQFVEDADVHGTSVVCTMSGKLNGEVLTYRFVCDNPEDFPTIPQIEDKDLHSKVGGADLGKALKSTAFAVSKDTLRPAMTGVYFDSGQNGFLTLAATDAHIFSQYIIGRSTSKQTVSFIIPSKAIALLQHFMADEPVTVYSNKGNSFFKVGTTEIACLNIDARYPDYKAIIPNEYCEILSFSKKEMLAQLAIVEADLKKRSKGRKEALTGAAWKIADNKSAFYSMTDRWMESKNKQQIKWSDTAVANLNVQWGEVPINIGIDVGYATRLLKNLEGTGDRVEFKISGLFRAILINVGSSQNQGLLMPIMYESADNFKCSHDLSPLAPIRTVALVEDVEEVKMEIVTPTLADVPLFEAVVAPSVSKTADTETPNFDAKLTDEQVIEFAVWEHAKLLKTLEPFKHNERVIVTLHGLDKDLMDKYNGKEARVIACLRNNYQKVYKVWLVRFDDGFSQDCRLEDLEKLTPSVSKPKFDLAAEKINIIAAARSRRIRILKLKNAKNV